MNEERVKLVLRAQKEFPELLESDAKYISDFRGLYIKLGLNESQYARWVNKNIVQNEFFAENKDWFLLDIRASEGKRGNFSSNYKITVDFAKHLCMMARTEKAHEIRNYFIYLEESIKDMKDWYNVRNPQKESYVKMTNIIKEQYMKEHDYKEPSTFIYTNNADMINMCLFGFKSKQIKGLLDIEYEDSLRDNIVIECNKAIDEIQTLNANLVISNVDFQTRKVIITNACNAKFLSARVKLVSEFSKELNEIKNVS